jgi:DNA (cytosine-5)-methyltransferase 1
VSGSPPRSIDLFAGCGGLSLGLHRAGFEGLFAIERDSMAFETLRSNLIADDATYNAYPKWPDWLPKEPTDIRTLMGDRAATKALKALRGSVALVAGGPPCQGFSVGGARNGTDERNKLVHELLAVVALVRPAVALIENVEGIRRPFKSRPGDTTMTSVADQVVEALGELDYVAAHAVVDASRFGVPQARRRAIIIGIRADLKIAPARFFEKLEEAREPLLEALGLPIDRPVTAREALADLSNPTVRVPCPDSLKFESTTYLSSSNPYGDLLRAGMADGAVPDSHRFTKHGDRIDDLYRLAHETQPKGRLTKSFLLANGTKKDKKVLIDPDTVVSTVTTHPDEFIHYAEARNVTVREMARLQSFPDDFAFKGRYTINGPRRRFDVARCSQVGNAVPPHLGQAIGMAVRGLLGD